MNNLKEKIKADFKEAFKAKEEIRLSVLKMVNAAIGNAEIEKRAKIIKGGGEATEAAVALNDEEVLQVISREIKKRKDSIEMYGKANRPELAERENKEAEVLVTYMPAQISEAEIRNLVKKAVEQSGAKSDKEIGKVMAVLMPQIKGKANGALVNKIVKELLSAVP